MFPRAALVAIIPTIAAVLIRSFSGHLPNDIQDELLGLEKMRTIYQSLTWVLGFVLVFRTQIAYSRYWDGANHLMKMTTEWCDACMQVLCFSDISDHAAEQVQSFQNAVVRLFSLLHGLALQEIAVMEDESFECLDLTGIDPALLEGLQDLAEPGEKCDVVVQWIIRLVLEAMKNGIIPTPPPVVSRFFQEMNSGMISFRSMVLISEVQFPFPYAQVVSLLLGLQLALTPFIVGTLDAHVAAVGIFSFASTCSLVVLTLTAQEIELPFGDDPNDLDCGASQRAVNRDLLILLRKNTRAKPLYAIPLGVPESGSLDKVKSREYPEAPTVRKSINSSGQLVESSDGSGYARRMSEKQQIASKASSRKKKSTSTKVTNPISPRQTIRSRIVNARCTDFEPGVVPPLKKPEPKAAASPSEKSPASTPQVAPSKLADSLDPESVSVAQLPPEVSLKFLEDVEARFKCCEQLHRRSCSELCVVSKCLVQLHDITLDSAKRIRHDEQDSSIVPLQAQDSQDKMHSNRASGRNCDSMRWL